MHRTLVHRIDLAISLISIVFFVWLSAVNPAIIEERIETMTLIYRFQIRNLIQKPPVPKNIVTVLVDEKSLSEFGRWPWPRTLQAELMTSILDQDPKVLAIDIMYPEKWAGDGKIAKALSPYKRKVVLATAFSVPENQEDLKERPEAPDYLTDSAILTIKDMKLGKAIQADGIIPPVAEIGKNVQLGHAYNRR
ncbi:MAG: CHASE2 domain-containing protein, partial [Nitrospirota bacterium]|nr:CHASE2 domain-containing protein [Nitrospirota bacterium]